MNQLTEEFWNERWATGKTGWDIGYPSPAIVKYFERVKNKEVKILIPGCGNAYEAHALLTMGFSNIVILDISNVAVQQLQKSFAFTNAVEILHMDFFDLDDSFDYIIEQTFFCALHPTLRIEYAKKMYDLLNPKGKLVGLLFNRKFDSQGPPYGGSKEIYIPIFERYFHFRKFEKCELSISPRSGSELFIEFQKK